MVRQRLTNADLEQMPRVEGYLYELIDGVLHVSTQPDYYHQRTVSKFVAAFEIWDPRSHVGEAVGSPGVIFAEDTGVAPDVAWIARDRVRQVLDNRGHLRAAPDLIVEVLSPGAANERRDLVDKLALYAREGVREYWVANWPTKQVRVFRLGDDGLVLVATLNADDVLTSPLLPGFAARVGDLCVGPDD